MAPAREARALIRRRFLQVGQRRVHYLRAGDGPPAVLIHSSPANATFLLPEIEHLAADYTVFAFDTPGFGLSQALALDPMQVSDLADALAETLRAIAMPPCPVFGSHSGAAIALELGVRHPDQVTGLVLDGVPAFTDEECAAFFGDYFRKIPVSDLGGHYAAVWTRFRDQSIWFPWSGRAPERLNGYDLGSPDSTHLWASMFFDAQDSYTPAYHATSHYGGRAIVAAAALRRPAIYTATDTDMLFGHMARLGPLQPDQEIRRIGTSHAAKRALITEGFCKFGSPGAAPADRDAIGAGTTISRQFVEGGDGRQIHVRYAGAPETSPVLLLHDGPSAAAGFEPLILALADRCFVVAPDLPGAGHSDRLPQGSATIADFAREAAGLMTALGIASAQVFAIGFGASVALNMAQSWPDRFGDLAICGALLPDGAERAELAARYAPPIAIEPDGAHWYRTWLMLRDTLVWWPWYDRRRDAQRRVPADFSAGTLHRWTLDVMRARESYGDLVQAALAHDAAGALAALQRAGRPPAVLLGGQATPLTTYDAKLTALLPGARSRAMPPSASELADMLSDLFTEGYVH